MAAAVVLATRNAHKLREFQRLLPDVELVPLPDEIELPPETGETFEENALIKARAAAEATNRPSIADDSGIEAEALGGRPGVRSARYAGEHATDGENLDKLRAEAPPGSGLRYVCVVAYIEPGDGRRARSRAPARAGWPRRPAAREASATTPCSSPPTATAPARWPSSPTRRRTASRTADAPSGRRRHGCRAGDPRRRLALPRGRRSRSSPTPR